VRANKRALINATTAYDVDKAYADWSDEPDEPEACANASECTAGEIAARDIAEWSRSVYNGLPGGAGFVSVQEVGELGAQRHNYTADIWIAWLDPDADDYLPGADGGECPESFEVKPDEGTQPRCVFFRIGV
jgi:hypothetical protein